LKNIEVYLIPLLFVSYSVVQVLFTNVRIVFGTFSGVLSTSLFIYVCMYVNMCVCMYVSVYVFALYLFSIGYS